ncbi:MAG: AMP-dependent synthetase and ligase [Actinomycetia bacterium]|nr:AMP-dependent synthetase and ligase [Actinomycetes bacterium]
MLPETTREAARRFGDTTAYVALGGWELSYADLDRISDEVAAGLRARGVGEGDVVALVLPPGPEYLVAYLAAAKAGAITAGVNDKLAAGERHGVLGIARPALILAAPGLEPDPAAVTAPVISLEAAPDAESLLAPVRIAGGKPAPLDDDAERPVAIIFTSGTTGLPKGAVYTNRQLSFITQTDVGDTWGTGGRSSVGTAMAHLGFMTKLPSNLRRGGTTWIMGRWNARDALRFAEEHSQTSVGGVPTQVALMLRDPDFDSYDVSAVQLIVVGGGPLTPGLAQEARERFGAKLMSRYSCTEAGVGLGTAPDDPDEDAVVSVGRPLPGVEMVLLDEDDQPVPEGEVGRVCLRSPAVMAGYWNDEETTRAAFTADGYVRTGDLGWVDDRGRLRLVGRSKEMYVRGGYNVYPVEVESVFSTHPGVAAIAIVPRPDGVMGEIGCAVVVPKDPAHPPTLEDLRAFTAGRLAPYKRPEALLLVDALPLTAMEKLDRRELARIVAEG